MLSPLWLPNNTRSCRRSEHRSLPSGASQFSSRLTAPGIIAAFARLRIMEAERLNALEHTLTDLHDRAIELRRYL
jgi:hypothetical protein